MLPPASASLEVELCGTGHYPDGRSSGYALFQAAVTSRVEVGIDRAVRRGPPVSLVNAKWQLLAPARGGIGLAIGMQNLGEGAHPEPYAVGTCWAAGARPLNQMRLHFGVIRSSARWRVMAGVDSPLGSVALQADYLGAPDEVGSVGLAVPVGSDVTVTYAAVFSGGGGPVGHLINVAVLVGTQGAEHGRQTALDRKRPHGVLFR